MENKKQIHTQYPNIQSKAEAAFLRSIFIFNTSAIKSGGKNLYEEQKEKEEEEVETKKKTVNNKTFSFFYLFRMHLNYMNRNEF